MKSKEERDTDYKMLVCVCDDSLLIWGLGINLVSLIRMSKIENLSS